MKALIGTAATVITVASLVTAASGKPLSNADPIAVEQISYRDLDLRSAGDQIRLRNRISYAAYRLCLVDGPASPTPSIADPVCFRNAMNEGLAQLHRAVAQSRGSTAVAAK